MKLSWDEPRRATKYPCANCGRPIPSTRRGSFAENSDRSDIVCTMVCGNELAHRLVRAIGDDWRAFIQPGDVSNRSQGKR